MPFPRLIAAALGLALPLVLVSGAQAAPRHHHAARVQTATYKVRQHTVVRHHHASLPNRRMAQVRHHSIMRGS